MPEIVNLAGPPAFDLAVPDRGYRWWYLDAVSDDSRHALVIIAFVGSVFRLITIERARPDRGSRSNIAPSTWPCTGRGLAGP